jgi:hypothetical protein
VPMCMSPVGDGAMRVTTGFEAEEAFDMRKLTLW